MINVTVECPCGQRFQFEVEPVQGRMPQPVHCPACGSESTDLANTVIEKTLPAAEISPANPPLAVRLQPLERSGPSVRPAIRKSAARAGHSPLSGQGKPASFWADARDGLTYPFRGRGIYILVGGTIFFGLINIVLAGGLAGLLVQLVVDGYLCAYLLQVVQSSAQREEEPPSWPDFSNLWEDILHPFLLVLATTLCALLPLIVLRSLGLVSEKGSLLWLVGVGLGFVYWPMAFLAVALLETVAALNPLLILPSMAKVAGQYLFVCLFTLLFLLIYSSSGPWQRHLFFPLAMFLKVFLYLYLLLAEMRILGLLYCRNREVLGWI